MKHVLKKAFFERNDDNNGYTIPDCMDTNNAEIYYANQAIDPWDDMNVTCCKDNAKKTAFIWSSDSFLDCIQLKFDTIDEKIAFEKIYDEYRKKRWLEMPQVRMSIDNFEYYKAEWDRLDKELPRYVIVTLDKSGPLDKLEIVGKDELSEQDKEDIKRENTDLLRWKEAEAWRNYDHDIIDSYWRSPADSVYDSDTVKYLGRTEGFVKHRQYAKAEVIAELQEKLKRNEPVYLIVHWLYIRRGHGIIDKDPIFDALLENFGWMDTYPEDMISREKLQEIADRLSFGQDVVLD